MADYIHIKGETLRVEANWNAVIAFLEALGTEDMTAVDMTKPKNWAPMMAACINEGERLDGSDRRVTALELGAEPDFTSVVTEFIQIYVKQTQVKQQSAGSKKA